MLLLTLLSCIGMVQETFGVIFRSDVVEVFKRKRLDDATIVPGNDLAETDLELDILSCPI